MIWFTADTHFGHKNIIKHCDRPFDSVEEMDETMISNWNDRVQKGDRIYHLGDFAVYCSTEHAHNILKRLNGEIFLIRGNHDKTVKSLEGKFAFVRDYYELKYKPIHVCLFHYALRTWRGRHYGSWHLYGHSHGSLPPLKGEKCCDVGVDVWDYSPVSIEELQEKFTKEEQ